MNTWEYIAANCALALLLGVPVAWAAWRKSRNPQRFEHRVVFLSKQSSLADWIEIEEQNGYEIVSIQVDGGQWLLLTKRPK